MLVEASGIVKSYVKKQTLLAGTKRLVAVRGVDLHVGQQETLGLVGESGCGKSTLGRCLIRLQPIDSGKIVFDGRDLTTLKSRDLSPFRRRMQIVFQDPYSSLNPRASVGSILDEPMSIHGVGNSSDERRNLVRELAQSVGLSPDVLDRFPHEFSGGQRQRIGIARAIAVKPEFIVCDEPVSALDVSVQAQIINLLLDLQERLKLSYLFISHDLKVIRHVSHRVMVMYLGQVVEEGNVKDIYEQPLHPYTQALLSAIPVIGKKKNRIFLSGEPPQAGKVPSGCPFHTRCPVVQSQCKLDIPDLKDLGGGRRVACLLVQPNR